MADSRTVTVELGERSYPIIIGTGLMEGAVDLGPFMPGEDCIVVSNETVAPIYGDDLRNCLPGRNITAFEIPDGERFKTTGTANSVLDALVESQANRDVTVVALGGGVVGDIAGFVAACYMRGVAFIQVPTTLLAQVDSSVGGKTGVNHPGGKNLIGAFHQPGAVLIDTATLETLPEREFRAGLAEVIKYGAIADAGFFAWLENNIEALSNKDSEALSHAITRSCEIKAAVVAGDEKEQGRRALLNFGHTFGHAIENSLGYGEWLHGEAVAAGMIMASAVSGVAAGDQRRLQDLVAAAGLPVAPPEIDVDTLLSAMRMDKKVKSKRIRLVLLKSLGEAYVTEDYDEEIFEQVLAGATD